MIGDEIVSVNGDNICDAKLHDAAHLLKVMLCDDRPSGIDEFLRDKVWFFCSVLLC